MFKICDQKGFHIQFENGWKISVQFGKSNYGGNYDFEGDYGDPVPPSGTAEIAAIAPNGDFMEWPDGDTVQGYQTPTQVLAAMNMIASK